MTVITALITGRFTVHATDSFLTVARGDGTFDTVESEGTKIVRVPRWRGAMSYFGLARIEGDWNTLAWLREQAGRAGTFASAEAFAHHVGDKLQAEISRRRFQNPVAGGIGLHFTAYEYVDGYWIPELFMISNFADPSYRSLRPGGIGVTRELYASLTGVPFPDRPASHGDAAARREVHAGLQHPYAVLWFNNGDPQMFNRVAGLVVDTIRVIGDRGRLELTDARAHADLARRPVEILSDLLTSFSKPNTRLIGGRPHDLVISAGGEYWSTSGD